MRRITLAVLTFALSGFAFAQMHGHGAGGGMGMGGGMQMNQAAGELADGEVRKVDRQASKLTLRHGPIARLDMPPMTMVYGVKDATMLEHLSVGDKVKFAVEKTDAGYTVTRVEHAH